MSYEEVLAALKQRYDGYRFHPKGAGMYNPFSVLNAFDVKELGSYSCGGFNTRRFRQRFLSRNKGIEQVKSFELISVHLFYLSLDLICDVFNKLLLYKDLLKTRQTSLKTRLDF